MAIYNKCAVLVIALIISPGALSVSGGAISFQGRINATTCTVNPVETDITAICADRGMVVNTYNPKIIDPRIQKIEQRHLSPEHAIVDIDYR